MGRLSLGDGDISANALGVQSFMYEIDEESGEDPLLLGIDLFC